jgi:homocysteine S-methyltransferase
MIINEILKEYPFLVLDGGMATELEKRGFDLNDHLWSAAILAEKPSAIRDVHLAFLEAGADCIITSSYQATIDGFMKKGYSSAEAANLIKLSVKLARKAVKIFMDNNLCAKRPLPFIAGSAGCYGASLADGSEYRGDYHLEIDEYIKFHKYRVELLAESGADVIAFETIPCTEEGFAVIELMKFYPDLPYWITFTVKDDLHISNGDPFPDFVKKAEYNQNFIGCGINCSRPENVTGVMQQLSGMKRGNFVVYPNSGEIYDKSCNCWKESGEKNMFMSYTGRWYNLGAKIIGGCCRTGPEEIRYISDFRAGLMGTFKGEL